MSAEQQEGQGDGSELVRQRREAFFQRHKTPFLDPSRFYLAGAARVIDNELDVYDLWLTDFPERAFAMAEEMKGSDQALAYFVADARRALRAIEGQSEWISLNIGYEGREPKVFNAAEFCDNTLSVHRKCGARVRRWFTSNYGNVVAHGLNPQQYFEMTIEAVEKMGRKAGAFFVYGLPMILEAKGDPEVFFDGLAQVTQVMKERSFRKAQIFKAYVLRAAPAIKSGDTTFPAFTQYAIRAIREFDEATAFSLVSATGGVAELAQYDYTLEDLHRTARHIAETRPKQKSAAAWYAWGIDALGQAHRRIGQTISANERDPTKLSEASREAVLQLKEAQQQLSPHAFTQEYQMLLGRLGRGAAVVYALSVKDADSGFLEEIPESIAEFTDLPQQLIALRNAVSAKVFREAMWQLPKIRGEFRDNLPDVFQAIIALYLQEGEQEVIRRFRYAAGAARNRAVIDKDLQPIPKWKLIDEAWKMSGFAQPPDMMEEEMEQEPDRDMVRLLFGLDEYSEFS